MLKDVDSSMSNEGTTVLIEACEMRRRVANGVDF